MSLRDREMAERLSNFEYAAEVAPEGTFYATRQMARILGEISNGALTSLRDHNLHAGNDDRLRNLEVEIYRYMVESNPDLATEFMAAEAFGEHVQGPSGDRIRAQIIRDRDSLKALSAG